MASLIATILFELARWGFAWYVTFAHEALALYGVLGGLMFFFFLAALTPHWSLFLEQKRALPMNKPICARLKSGRTDTKEVETSGFRLPKERAPPLSYSSCLASCSSVSCNRVNSLAASAKRPSPCRRR